jgi:hypothetical protein
MPIFTEVFQGEQSQSMETLFVTSLYKKSIPYKKNFISELTKKHFLRFIYLFIYTYNCTRAAQDLSEQFQRHTLRYSVSDNAELYMKAKYEFP